MATTIVYYVFSICHRQIIFCTHKSKNPGTYSFISAYVERNLNMLVLSRKKDEKIILKHPDLPEDIMITIVKIDNRNKVRIGIEADKEVTVLRSELEPTTYNND